MTEPESSIPVYVAYLDGDHYVMQTEISWFHDFNLTPTLLEAVMSRTVATKWTDLATAPAGLGRLMRPGDVIIIADTCLQYDGLRNGEHQFTETSCSAVLAAATP